MRNFIKAFTFLFVFLWFAFYASIKEINAATITAVSCSYDDVSSAISSASAGDTVTVPSGSCTWSNRLEITKGIKLISAGVGITTLTSNYTKTSNNDIDPVNYLISYVPDTSSIANNTPFRLTGFTIDLASKCGGIMLVNKTTTAINKVRVDHNRVINADATGMARAFTIRGTVYGVVDNNTLSGNGVSWQAVGLQATSWSNLTFSYGDANNMYFEDNTVDLFTSNMAHDGGGGGRYVERYNTYTYNNATNSLAPWFDMHGNQVANGNLSTMGSEIYGNVVTSTFNRGVNIFDQRGGKALIFFNKTISTSGGTSQTREEDADSSNPPATASNGQPQHVSDSYYWNNRNNTTLQHSIESSDCCDAIAENSEFYNHNVLFNGTTGVGCGTVASMPATCTTGVAYWATTQSCSSVDSPNIGAHPITPISGTLYKCTATNIWTGYYMPYLYPHPLTIPPSPPSNFKIQ